MPAVDYDVVIVGGGLAGLAAANLLADNRKVLVLEKKAYPFHKVCGEYISNEVLLLLKSIGFDPFRYGASSIKRLRVSTPKGKNIYINLDLGGFGLSRYEMDNALYQLALKKGAEVKTHCRANDISFSGDHFVVQSNDGAVTAHHVIGSYGKRDTLDKKLKRSFIDERTHYMGVKYHIKTGYPIDEIGLDCFDNGYCGIVKVERDIYNLCYLYQRKHSKHTIKDIEETILFKNPVIRNIFQNSDFVFSQPEVINEISFRKKPLIEDHIIMCGDSAGLITPLCGNGMSMAVHAAAILSRLLLNTSRGNLPVQERIKLEREYIDRWKKNFSKRLLVGRTVQSVFGNPAITSISLRGIHFMPSVEKWIIKNTHGKIITP